MSEPHELPNIPRDDKTIKRAIIPKLEALSFFDYSAIEPRLFAYYAAKMGYPELAKLVNDGIDPYTAVAVLIEQKDDITKEERQHWKVFFLSLMYGGGVTTIRKQFNCNSKQAYRMIDKFHENFPAVRSLQDTVAATAQRRGYVLGIDGRHLHPEPYGEHKMLNKLVQGGAAAIMKQAIVRVHTSLKAMRMESQIISVVHDDLWIDGPESEVYYLHELVPGWMLHHTVNAVVPIAVDHEVTTTNAAEKQPYDAWRETA